MTSVRAGACDFSFPGAFDQRENAIDPGTRHGSGPKDPSEEEGVALNGDRIESSRC